MQKLGLEHAAVIPCGRSTRNAAARFDSNATIRITTTLPAGQTARVNAWIDFNRDGDWGDAGETILNDLPVQNGNTNLTISVPGSALGRTSYARFRLSTNGKLGPGGSAADGEVEDYEVVRTQALDYGDAPSPYPTTLAQNGARHNFTNDFCLGFKVDGEVNGQPDPAAAGDDFASVTTEDDEDGVTFTSSIVPGQSALVARPSIAGRGFAEVEQDFLTTLRRAGLLPTGKESLIPKPPTG